MAKNKTTTTKRSTAKRTGVRKRTTRSRRSSGRGSALMTRFAVPVAVITFLVGILGLVASVYYRSIAESDLFKVKTVDVRGTERTSAEDVTRLILASTDKKGLLDADISEMRAKVEEFPFVKNASVSRQFPSGIRVDIVEKIPVAIVKLKAGDRLVDEDGEIIDVAKKTESDLPFAIVGWDETKSEEAYKGNKERLKVYKKMVEEWEQFGLIARVRRVDLSRPNAPAAVIEDSGNEISVILAGNRLGKSLRSAIETIAGKGGNVSSVNVADLTPIIKFIEN